jgi:hypothetical protein
MFAHDMIGLVVQQRGERDFVQAGFTDGDGHGPSNARV